jgi:hypothetical protein
MSKRKHKHRKERRQLIGQLVLQYQISAERARAIAKRYGPSEDRCVAAAEALCRLKSLLGE